MEQPLFHVMLAGRRLGPYDRRTIVGMRIRKTLSSANLLVDSAGAELTVADLIARRPPTPAFNPNRTTGQSVVRALLPASLVQAEDGPFRMLPFRGEMEVRVQAETVRIAGRYRRGLRLKEDRVKLPLDAIAHLQVQGSLAHLGLRGPAGVPQRITLDLFTEEGAAELAGWLPEATPWPESAAPPAPGMAPTVRGTARPPSPHLLPWVAVATTAVVVGLVLFALVYRRLF